MFFAERLGQSQFAGNKSVNGKNKYEMDKKIIDLNISISWRS